MKWVSKEFVEKNERRLLLAIMGLALLLRLLFSFHFGNELIWYDEHNYHSIAESILRGDGFYSTYDPPWTTHWPPLQGYVLAGIYAIFGSEPRVGRIFQDVYGLIILLLIFLIGKKLFSVRIALIGALVFAVHPVFIYVSNTLYSETLFTTLLLTTFYSLMRAIELKRWPYFAVSGVLLGLAMLARPVAIFVLPAIFLWLLVKNRFLYTVTMFALILIMASVTISPWIYYNYAKYGKVFFITQEGAHSLAAANHPLLKKKAAEKQPQDHELVQKLRTAEEDERNKLYYKLALSYILNHPLDFMKNYLTRFVKFWRVYPDTLSQNRDVNARNKLISALFYIPFLVLAFIGMFQNIGDWRKIAGLYLFVLFFALGYSFFSPSIRYRLPVEPYLILFLAAAAENIFLRKRL